MCIQWAIEEFDTLPSTQSFIKSDRPNAAEGTLILAHHQTDGYGRHGRSWEEGAGNLYFSFILEPHCSADQLGQISLLISLAIYQTLKSYLPKDRLQIKWPNDVLLDGKKCSGILIESADQVIYDKTERLIIGIGINTISAPLSYATSLKNHTDQSIDNAKILQSFIKTLDKLYQEWKVEGFGNIMCLWEKASFERGAPISVKQGSKLICGKYIGIDHTGALKLDCDQTKTTRIIHAGDVFLQPKSA